MKKIVMGLVGLSLTIGMGTAHAVTEVDGLKINGGVSTAYSYAFNNPRSDIIQGRPLLQRHNSFDLSIAQLELGYDLNDIVTINVGLIAGQNAPLFGPQGSATFGLEQANVVFHAPVGNGLDITVGHFKSLFGYEGDMPWTNRNITRSLNYGSLPFSHTGLLLTYKIDDLWSISGAIVNGLNNALVQDANAMKTFIMQVAVADENWFVKLNGSVGADADYIDGTIAGDDSDITDIIDLSAGVNIDQWKLGVQGNVILQQDMGKAIDYWGANLYVSYDWEDAASINLRGGFHDYNSGIVLPANVVAGPNLNAYTADLTFIVNITEHADFRIGADFKYFDTDVIEGSDGLVDKKWIVGANTAVNVWF